MTFLIRFKSSNTGLNPVEFDGIKMQAALIERRVPTVRGFRIVQPKDPVVRKNRRTASHDARKLDQQSIQRNTTHQLDAICTEAATCKRYLQVGQRPVQEFNEHWVLPNTWIVIKKAEDGG